MKIPRVGDIVHYVLDFGPSFGQVRPAIVVRIWGDLPYGDFFDLNNPAYDACVQLQVFTDGANDYFESEESSNVVWRTSVKQSDADIPGTFHFSIHASSVVATPFVYRKAE